MLIIPSRVIPACFALAGFAAAAIVGGFAGNEIATVLWRALLAMAACWLIGRLVSYVAQRAVGEHIDQYKQHNPIPDDLSAGDTGASSDVPPEMSPEGPRKVPPDASNAPDLSSDQVVSSI